MGKTQLFLALTSLTVLISVGLGSADIPDELEASIGGMGGFYSVHLNGETVVYVDQRRSEPEHKINFTPRREDWEKFNSLLKEADVWNWEAEYIEPNLADGTQWSLYIKQGGREKKIKGSNRYPPSEKFKKYLEAIQLLIGNNRFQ